MSTFEKMYLESEKNADRLTMSAQKKINTAALFLDLPSHIDEKTIGKLTAETNLDEYKEVILNFKNTTEVDRSFHQSLYRFKRDLSVKSIELKSTNVDKKIAKFFQDHGTESFLNRIKNDDNKLIDVNFIQPFVNSTVNVLQVQAHIDCSMKPPSLKAHFQIPYELEIAGVLSIVSDHFMGSIALCFPLETFMKVCEGIFGETFSSVDPQMEEAAAELLNMIFGGAKAELNERRNYNIQKALPTVVRAKSLSLRQYNSTATLVIPFQSSAGPFHIDIEFLKKNE